MKTPVAVLLGLSAALIRFIPENSLIFEVSDAQGGIAMLAALLIAIFVIMIATPVAYQALHKKGVLRMVWVIVFGAICAYQFHHASVIKDTANTLTLAKNPGTEPVRLSAIGADSSSHYGYAHEIDNRLASNPNSPEPLLITLYAKDQLGTKMCLARNRTTPVHILTKLAGEQDTRINASLKMNPAFRETLKDGSTKSPR